MLIELVTVFVLVLWIVLMELITTTGSFVLARQAISARLRADKEQYDQRVFSEARRRGLPSDPACVSVAAIRRQVLSSSESQREPDPIET
jgi:hypothetical protein